MIRPTNKQVTDLLKEKKLLQSVLWDIRPKNWLEKHYKEWEKIMKAPKTKPLKPKDKRIMIAVNRIKVIRLSDGYIFESIVDCMKKEGFYKDLMTNLLANGIEYKKVI